MTDQQKVQLLPCPWCGRALVEYRNRMNPYARCETAGCFMHRCPVVNLDYALDIEAWNTRQAAIAHASSATVKENLTVGEDDAVAWMTHHEPPMLFPTREEAAAYCADDEQPLPLYTHPLRADADGERVPLVRLVSLIAQWRRIADKLYRAEPANRMRDCADDFSRVVAEHQAIDQALAAEWGEK